MTQAPTADQKQISGDHYKIDDLRYQHWAMLHSRMEYGFEYFTGQATRYITRWRKKNGLRDLLKGQHFIEKLTELAEKDPYTFLPFYGYDDATMKDVVTEAFNDYFETYYRMNEVDDVSASICMSVLFANSVRVLRDATEACSQLAQFEKMNDGDKADLEPPVAQKFAFNGYVDGGVAMRWTCRMCGEAMQLEMNQPPSLHHTCGLLRHK